MAAIRVGFLATLAVAVAVLYHAGFLGGPGLEGKRLLTSVGHANLDSRMGWMLANKDDPEMARLFTEQQDHSCVSANGDTLCHNCAGQVLQQVESTGLVQVEDFSNTEAFKRNVIGTAKEGNPRYKELLQNAAAAGITFVATGITCGDMFETIGWAPETLSHCAEDVTQRRQLFQMFAYQYGVRGGRLPSSTCFVDMGGPESGVAASANLTDCVPALAFERSDEVANGTSQGPAKIPLDPISRAAYAKAIRKALARTPQYRDDFARCNLPLWLARWVPASLLSDVCWKQQFVQRQFPEYQLAIFGLHGVGKSTWLQYLALYAGISLGKTFATVCVPGTPSCTLTYERNQLSKSHYFYDTKGFTGLHDGAATATIVETAAGEGVALGCRMDSSDVVPNPCSGWPWFGWFGADCSTWQRVASLAWTVWCWLLRVAALVLVCLLGAACIDLCGGQAGRRGHVVLGIVLLLFYLYAWAALLPQPPSLAPIPRCQRGRDGKFVKSPRQKQMSKIHALNVFFPMPKTDAEYGTYKEFLVGTRAVIAGKHKDLGKFSVGISVTDSSACKKHTMDMCRREFENRLNDQMGWVTMLDTTAYTGQDPESRRLIGKTGVFLEPDRVLAGLKDLQVRAGEFYNSQAEQAHAVFLGDDI